MGMSTFRNPVGPQPASVYWRRRVMVGLGLVAVIAIILLIVFSPRGEGAEPKVPVSSGSPTDPTDAPKDTSDSGAEGAACAPSDVSLEPVTDKSRYAAGEQPRIGLTVTNTGSAPCIMNLGTTVQELLITSGSDQIWSSKHCQVDPVDAERVLEPGVPMSTPLIPWDRTRSSTSTCESQRPAVVAGGASYHLKVFIGELESEGTKQFILN